MCAALLEFNPLSTWEQLRVAILGLVMVVLLLYLYSVLRRFISVPLKWINLLIMALGFWYDQFGRFSLPELLYPGMAAFFMRLTWVSVCIEIVLITVEMAMGRRSPSHILAEHVAVFLFFCFLIGLVHGSITRLIIGFL